jgi:hypothetical protein
MKKAVLLLIACAAALAQCDIWQKPLIEAIVKETKKVDSIEKIMVTKYPFPNTFSKDNETLAVLKNGGAAVWENECGLEVSGITNKGEIRKLTAPEYTVEGFDPALEYGGKYPVTITLNGAPGVITSFDIAIVSFSGNYHEVKIAAGIINGALVPFPSLQKEGEPVTVYIYPDDGYAYAENSFQSIPPPPQADFSHNEDGTITFTMPGGDLTLTAEFFEAAAKLELDGNIRYFETLGEAFDKINSGEEAVVTVLKNLTTVQSEISVTGKVTLAAADGPVKTVKRGSGTGSLFTVSGAGASLELDAGFSLGLALDGGWDNITQSGLTADAPLVTVSGGKLKMGAGVVLQNNRNDNAYGGGVHILNSGTFIMENGGIKDNKAQHGGGVYISSGSFEMKAGSINGNTAAANTSGHAYGGGVYIGSNGIFTMDGGEISGNKAQGASAYGGGVYVEGEFTIKDSSISGNTVNNNSNGVYVNGSFEMSGAVVVKQEVYLSSGKRITVSDTLVLPESETYSASIRLAAPSDGTVVLEGDAYTLTGEDVAKFKLPPSYSDAFIVYNNNKGIFAQPEAADAALYFIGDTPSYAPTLAGAISGIGAGTTAAIYIVQDEITLASNIPVSGNVTLTVPGDVKKTVKRGGSNGSLFTVSGTGASLTLDASSGELTLDGGGITADAPLVTVTTGGKLKMGNGVKLQNNKSTSNGGGVAVSGSGSRFEMSGGEITGNTAGNPSDTNEGGGGVFVDNGATFEMSGGTISNNKSDKYGGGVRVNGNSTFTMSGGSKISDNTADNYGGGIYIANSIFTMTGGLISGNTAGGESIGGGVYIYGTSAFTMNDGEISHNKADRGGGVLLRSGTFEMSGNSVISNNESTTTGGGVCIEYNGAFNMNAGTISGNTAADQGGGVYQTNGTFTMTGGTIYGSGAGNLSNTAGNGAAYYKAGGTSNPTGLVTTDSAIINGAVQ